MIQSDYFNDLTDVVINGKKLDPPKNLQWYVNVVIFSSVLMRASYKIYMYSRRYPNGLAWQLDLERKTIRHNEVLKRLKQFLVTETESVSWT